LSDESKVPPKGMIRLFTGLNTWVYRLSGGRLMNRMEGAPICLVTMTGRRSGKRKTICLMYTPHGKDVVLVASLGGSPTHPVWYYNLKANPEIVIQVGTKRRTMLARETAGAERAQLWSAAVANYASFATYQTRTTREIPVFICEPR
jgi:F420H(2)-dependent quinone reductase